ncbi:MAG: helix-turn-helix domain-containing protein [Tessaracoccus sp.]|uniref:helix-turn-helix domain-containing protein n=1 Tax=Tessaracoccus sp. TaxID=1971211 RepID=UPI001EB7BCC0|nr:helix-turn-helix domain-containing protein [Tessaracoccus sp.]MBK7820422.1 helix-turn-helix domain-containing protein [Tessaracoccus sp.]
MTELATALSVARSAAGISLRDLARIGRLSPSVISKAENGSDVAMSTYRRLIDAADLGPDLRPLGRPEATYVARALLEDEDTYEAPLPADFPYWIERWQRLGIVDDQGRATNERLLAMRAGRSGYLARRPMSVRLPRVGTAAEIGKALGSSGVEYAITGGAGANRLVSYASEPWPVLYVSDLAKAVEALGIIPRLPGQFGPSTTLIAFDGFNDSGRWQSQPSGLWYAAPWQIVLDCYGGVDRMINQADVILDSWEDNSND